MITGLKINEQRKQMYYEKGYWGKETVLDVWNNAVEKYGLQKAASVKTA